MIEAIIELVATLLRDAVQAGDDRAKQEAALMAAEEKLARLRAEKKFGP